MTSIPDEIVERALSRYMADTKVSVMGIESPMSRLDRMRNALTAVLPDIEAATFEKSADLCREEARMTINSNERSIYRQLALVFSAKAEEVRDEAEAKDEDKP